MLQLELIPFLVYSDGMKQVHLLKCSFNFLLYPLHYIYFITLVISFFKDKIIYQRRSSTFQKDFSLSVIRLKTRILIIIWIYLYF